MIVFENDIEVCSEGNEVFIYYNGFDLSDDSWMDNLTFLFRPKKNEIIQS